MTSLQNSKFANYNPPIWYAKGKTRYCCLSQTPLDKRRAGVGERERERERREERERERERETERFRFQSSIHSQQGTTLKVVPS
jgi:hypothetical protein